MCVFDWRAKKKAVRGPFCAEKCCPSTTPCEFPNKANHVLHALCQVLKPSNMATNQATVNPHVPVTQIEGLGLHVVNITRYVIRIKKHLHNRIEIIEIESNRKECESLHHYWVDVHAKVVCHLPCSQTDPLYPGKQVHAAVPFSTKHVPPFWQKRISQGSTIRNITYSLVRLQVAYHFSRNSITETKILMLQILLVF